jgi:hypothetical protein
MANRLRNAEADIRRALVEVEALMARAFAAVGHSPEPGSALDQAGLRDGGDIISDYLCHGEHGLALEHLIYMVREPSLPISRETFTLIDQAGRTLGMAPGSWEDIRPGADV